MPRFFLWTVLRECAKGIKYTAVWAWKRWKQFSGSYQDALRERSVRCGNW